MEDITKKIREAQTNSGRSPDLMPCDFKSLGEALSAICKRNSSSKFLTYLEDGTEIASLDYSEFELLVTKTASWLASKGISKGDRVAIAAYNHVDTVVQYFACWILNCCVVPLNMGEDDNRLSYIVSNSKASLLLCREEFFERITNCVTSEFAIVKVDQVYHSEIENCQTIEIVTNENQLEQDCLIVYTSGTTGNPKGVVLVQRNLFADGYSIGLWHNITQSTTMMCVLPIHHVNGTIVTLVTPFLHGAGVVLHKKFSSSSFFPTIQKYNVGLVSVVPTLLAFLLEAKADSLHVQENSLRYILCGAGPLTCELAQQFESHYKIRIMHGYGLSETTCYSCFLENSLSEEDHNHVMYNYGFPSIGTPLPCNEMEIHSPEGITLAEYERGEIVMRGWNVMREYYQNPTANSETFAHSWFRSGDEGFYITLANSKKYFFITGRLKELIIRGGVNLAPLEIDEVLAAAPGVKSGICVGFVNDFYGEEVGAIVVPQNSNVTSSQILEYCASKLPFSKTPKVVLFATELPVTSTGKYQRNKVKHLFAEWQSTQFKKS